MVKYPETWGFAFGDVPATVDLWTRTAERLNKFLTDKVIRMVAECFSCME